MTQPVLCLVTIHGIGFEQAPDNGTPGYADGLHERLSRAIGPAVLGDDPNRSRRRPGENGAIYVQSLWPPEGPAGDAGLTSQRPTREEGLRRLGRWAATPGGGIDTAAAPLADDDKPIAHVALVYSRLEAVGPHIGSGTIATEMAAVSVRHYASLLGLLRMGIADIGALRGRKQLAGGPAAPSLRVRTDPLPWHPGPQLPLTKPPAQSGPRNPTGLLATVRNLENDVATYVSRNDLRERVRSFVREALLRLATRDDVAGIVLNTHSNGTVIAFDVARELPAELGGKLRWFVTAGSPLRKYAELFNWGTEVGGLRGLPGWTNFWDATDPVADPLAPPPTWRRGDPLPAASGGTSLYHSLDPDTGVQSDVPIEDRQVDNSSNGGGGGLPAHNYWDNDREVVAPLAQILDRLVSATGAAVGS